VQGKCYTFEFDTNRVYFYCVQGVASGWSTTNRIEILCLNPFGATATLLMEQGDGDIYYKIFFWSISTYTFRKKELKFFYDNNSKYLLYEPY